MIRSRLREHSLFVTLFTVGLALRILAVAAYRPALLLQSDAYVYLRKSLLMEPAQTRPIFYSIFLKPFVLLHNIGFAVIAQHLLALGLAVLVYVFLRRSGVGPTLGALGTAPLLIDSYQVNIEHYILAETLFQGLSAGALLLVAWKRPTVGLGAGAGALIGLAVLTRFLGVVLLPCAAIYAWKRGGWRPSLALCAAVASPVLAYAWWFSNVYGEFGVTNQDGTFLYGRVATWVDCDRLEVPGYQRVLCDPLPPEERPDANRYVFREEPPGGELRPPAGTTRDEALGDFATSAIAQQPLSYLRVVSSGMLHYFAPTRSTGPHDNRLVHWRFPLAASDTEPHAFLIRKYEASPPPEIDRSKFHVTRQPAAILRTYQTFIYMYGPLLLAILLIALIGLVLRPRAPEDPDRRPVIALLTLSGLLLLLVPVATATFDYRFMLLTHPLLPVAASLSGDRILRRRASRV